MGAQTYSSQEIQDSIQIAFVNNVTQLDSIVDYVVNNLTHVLSIKDSTFPILESPSSSNIFIPSKEVQTSPFVKYLYILPYFNIF